MASRKSGESCHHFKPHGIFPATVLSHYAKWTVCLGPMKIAYATQFAADDIHSWSGLVYHLRRALQDAGCEVVTIDSLREKGRIPGKLLELAYKQLAGKTFIR